jgi:hypothetical protein
MTFNKRTTSLLVIIVALIIGGAFWWFQIRPYFDHMECDSYAREKVLKDYTTYYNACLHSKGY